MNEYQKRQRALHDRQGQWKRGAFSQSIRELIDHLGNFSMRRSKQKTTMVCNSDALKIYAVQLGKNPTIQKMINTGEFIHNITSSRRWRDMRNPLFPVNYIDSRLRNDLADWQRETTSFPRETNRNFQRFLCYIAFHNFFKPHRSSMPHISHAEIAGLPKEVLKTIREDFFVRRAFRTQFVLSEQWHQSWFCELITPLQVRNGVPYNGNRPAAYLYL